jgi:hypothetical protein
MFERTSDWLCYSIFAVWLFFLGAEAISFILAQAIALPISQLC